MKKKKRNRFLEVLLWVVEVIVIVTLFVDIEGVNLGQKIFGAVSGLLVIIIYYLNHSSQDHEHASEADVNHRTATESKSREKETGQNHKKLTRTHSLNDDDNANPSEKQNVNLKKRYIYVFGAKWTWDFSNNTIRNIRPICPTCDIEMRFEDWARSSWEALGHSGKIFCDYPTCRSFDYQDPEMTAQEIENLIYRAIEAEYRKND